MRVLLVLAPLALAACSNAGQDRILGLDATGVVTGTVYFDLDGNRELAFGTDSPMSDVGFRLTVQGGTENVGTATSDFDGFFSISRVPIGIYLLQVDGATVPDSMQVVRIDTSAVSLTAEDSAKVSVAISFPIVSVAQARAAAPGDKLFIEGTALNNIAAFGDGTVHISANSGTAVHPAKISKDEVAGNIFERDNMIETTHESGNVTLDVTTLLSSDKKFASGMYRSGKSYFEATDPYGTCRMQHALTQIPYALIAAAITIAGFLMLAYW